MKYFLLLILVGGIACNSSTPQFSVGGTITGLNGTVVLQNNAGDDLTLTADGSFTFPTEVSYGSNYSVTVLTQPTGQGCNVTQSSGTIGTADVTNVLVTCLDSLGSTTLIDVTPSIQTGVFSSYNSQRDQFLLTWWDADEDSIDFMIYNSDGSIAVPYTLLFDATMTPLSDVVSCYNSHLDEYFISWNEYTTSSGAFAIVDADGSVVQGLTALTGTHAPNGNVECSYNSTDHQYLLTWTDSSNDIFFAIINEDGTEDVSETSIPNVGGLHTSGPNVFSSYNSVSNEYFLTWSSSDFSVCFAIYDADGTALQTATAISSAQGYSDIKNCYNSVNDEYFIPWRDSGGVTYFSIYDADGTLLTSPQIIADFTSDIIYGPVNCSYNNVHNNYLLTGLDGVTLEVLYALVSDQGDIEIEPTIISNPSDLLSHKTVYSSFGETSDTTFITWMADDLGSVFNGYLVLYNFSP